MQEKQNLHDEILKNIKDKRIISEQNKRYS